MPLALLGACGGVSPDNNRLEAAVTTFVDTLGRGEYDVAASVMCPDAGDAAALRTEFEPHPRPWKRKVTYTGRGDDSGNANLDLTPEGRSVVKYTFGLEKLADGSWQVCDVTRGSVQVDVG